MTTTARTVAPSAVIRRLDFVECGVPTVDPDGRRVLRQQRDLVAAALRRGDRAEIARVTAYAVEVGEMWGVDLTA